MRTAARVTTRSTMGMISCSIVRRAARSGACAAVPAVLALACASSAQASTARLTWDVSLNGGVYSSSALVASGDLVRVRLRVSLTDNTGAGSIGGSGGLAGFDFLPTLTNFDPGDVITPLGTEQFPEGSANNPFPGVINHPDLGTYTNVYTGSFPALPGTLRGPGNVGGTGRNAPWGANGTNASGVPTPSVSGGVLSWRSSVIGNAGVSLSQASGADSVVSAVVGVDDMGTPGDTSDDQLIVENVGTHSNNSRNNLLVFTYEFRHLTFNELYPTMTASCSVLTPVRWFTSSAGTVADATNVVVTEAFLHQVVPAPGGVALLGLAGVFASRRRR